MLQLVRPQIGILAIVGGTTLNSCGYAGISSKHKDLAFLISPENSDDDDLRQNEALFQFLPRRRRIRRIF